MALKAVLASLEGVPEHLASEYKPGEGGKFFLDLEGLEDGSEHPSVGSLARAKKRESEARGKAEALAKELREKLEAKEAEMRESLKNVIPKENADRLEASYKTMMAEKIAAIEGQFKGEISTLSDSLRTVLVDSVAQRLAAELAHDAVHIPLMLPHITSRLAVERGADGRATTRVLDKEGKPSAATLDDLKKEILGNPMFAPILSGSKATGGGATGGSGGGGAPQKKPGPNATAEEWAAYAKAKRTGG